MLPERIKNPISGRMILSMGRTAKNLLRDGFIFFRNKLVEAIQFVTNPIEKSRKYWPLLKIGSKAFNNLIENNNYQFDENRGQLELIQRLDIKFRTKIFSELKLASKDLFEEILYNIYMQNLEKNMYVTIENITYDFQNLNSNNRGDLARNYTQFLTNLYMVLYELDGEVNHEAMVYITAIEMGQNFQHGVVNITNDAENCYIKLLSHHLYQLGHKIDQVKLFNEHTCNLSQNDMIELSNKCCLKTIIYLPDGNKHTLGKYNNHKSLKIYLTNGHVQLYEKKSDTSIIYVKDNMEAISKIDKDFMTFNNNIYTDLMNNIIYIVDENKDLELNKCFTQTQLSLKKFMNKNKFHAIKSNDKNIMAMKSLIHNNIHYNNKSVKVNMKIDMKKAYFNFDKTENYTGLPINLLSSVEYNDDTKYCIDKYEGFALSIDYFGNRRWLSFPYIRFLKKYNKKIDIEEMMISSRSIKKINKKIIEDDYFKVVGLMSKHQTTISFMSEDQNLEVPGYESIDILCPDDIMINMNGEIVLEEGEIYNDKSLKKFVRRVDYISKMYYPHVSAYIQQYIELEILQFIETNNIDIKTEIGRIWVDGISFIDKDYKIPDTFRIEECSQPMYYNCSYETDNIINKLSHKSKTFIDILQNKKNFCIDGEAGTGKTTMIRSINEQCSDSLILVPTHEIKNGVYDNKNVQTYQKIIAQNELFPYKQNNKSIYLVDECYMIPFEHCKNLNDINKNNVIIYIGDKNQLPAILLDKSDKKKEIQFTPFDKKKLDLRDNVTLTKNYRQESDKDLLQILRYVIKHKKLPKSYKKKMIKLSDIDINNDIIITSKNDRRNIIN
ncbi:MAG: AAA family ATPase, partial [Mycoplasmataceae bacterium]|nr:AAA family ATPase [Mycoplasmataceae bacterium]